MALQFTTVEEPSFDRGIDARSAENQIKAGFARDLVNVDIVESRVRKRRGYSSHAGNIPVRVRKIEQNNAANKISFILDSSIDLTRLSSCPLLAYGKSSNISSGPFTTAGNSYRYYPSWESNLRKSFAGSTTGTISAPYTEHNIETSEIFVGLAQSTGTGSILSGSTIYSTAVAIDDASYDISVGYTNGDSSPVSAFLYYRDQSPVSGKAYTHNFTVPVTTGTAHPVSINAATHQLDSYNIIYQLQRKVSGQWVDLKPGECTIDSAGTITFEFFNNTGATLTDCRALLSSVPASQTKSFSLSNTNITFLNVTSPFLFYNFYQVNGGTRTEIFLDDLSYNDAEKSITIDWPDNLTGTIEFYYNYGTIRTNKITVSDPLVASDLSDTVPQLSLYGLDHTTAYGDEKKAENRRGWVTHVDSYRSPTTTHVVAGLGGNFFAALTQDQVPEYPELLPTWYPSLNTRVSTTTQYIGPAFCDFAVGDIKRTRGAYTFTGGTFGWAKVESVTFVPGTGHTTYVLSTPNRSKKGTNPIVAGDFLTVEKMSHSRHSGTFEVVSCTEDVNTLTIVVKNPKLTTADYNDSETSGRAGVFTDQVELSSTSPFAADDQLLSSSWGEETIMRVYEVTTSTTVATDPLFPTRVYVADTSLFSGTGTISIDGESYSYTSKTTTYFVLSSSVTVTAGQTVKLVSSTLRLSFCYNNITLSSGLILTGRRRSASIPLRTLLNAVPASLNIVAGDVLAINDFAREFTVLSVSGNTVTLDEEVEWYDDFSLPPTISVARRWYPIESPTPTATDVLIPRTSVQYLDSTNYDEQPFIRSAMVRNNMYLTNGSDEVYKYDGNNVYRAGIIPWQPSLFAAVENVGSGGIGLTPVSVKITDAFVEGQKIKMPKINAAVLTEGDIVRVVFGSPSVTLDLTIFKIEDVDTTGTTVFISFIEGLSGVSDASTIVSISGIYYASYFFRFNIKDPNGVTVASAVSGDASCIVKIAPTTSAQVVLLRLVSLPVWDRYDYREGNIELEIFRSAWTTKAAGEVPFPYRLTTIPLTFETNSGYIDFTDTYSNIALSEEDSDLVSRILSPTEVPVTWDEPVRGKYLTTVGNRLVLGNITSWPTFTVEFLANKDVSANDFHGQKFTFRRDVSKTGTTTDMNNVVVYELHKDTSSTIRTIYPVTGIAGELKFETTTAIPSSATEGGWVYLYHKSITSGYSVKFTNLSGGQFVFPKTFIELPDVGSLIHFSTDGTLPAGGINNTSGFFVITSTLPTTTASSTHNNQTTLNVASTASFPTEGVFSHLGQYHTYTSKTATSFVGVSPQITTASNATITAYGVKVSSSYGGSAITFSNTGTGSHLLLWDGSQLDHAGWYQISNVSGNIVTIKEPSTSFSVIPTQFPDRALFADTADAPTKNVPVLVGLDGNMGMSSGNSSIPYLNVIRRLGMAINATMRVVDTELQAYKNFTPWLMAQSELWTGGQLLVKRARADQETPTLQIYTPVPTPPAVAQYSTYLNDELASALATPARTLRYPSRVLLSYDNYPEIFSNPFTDNLSTSISAVDINAADGQEITGVVPFFGSSAFDAAQQSGALVVFKQNSIYIVKADSREVQKLETQGLGCTAPYSIAPTKDGVAFANESGIYVLRRDYRIEYVGRFMERNWNEQVDLDALAIAQGHHYGIGKQYKLSIPLTENSTSSYAENEQVFVYNYTGEADGNLGGWTKYTNHYATGWCNLYQDAFYGDVNGKVQRIRNAGDSTDYRDEAAAITAIIESRPTAFENTAIRKAVSNIIVHYRAGADSNNTTLGMAVDLATEYQASTAFRVVTSGTKTGLADSIGQDVVSIMHSFPKRKCLYAGVQIVNSGLDDNVEVAGMSYVVAGLTSSGVKQAAETE